MIFRTRWRPRRSGRSDSRSRAMPGRRSPRPRSSSRSRWRARGSRVWSSARGRGSRRSPRRAGARQRSRARRRRSPVSAPSAPSCSRGVASPSVLDLLFHLPVRWDDRRSLARVGESRGGAPGQLRRARAGLRLRRDARAVARARWAQLRGDRRRRDRNRDASSGSAAASRSRSWCVKNDLLLVAGDVKRYRFSKQLSHPEIEVLAPSPSEGRGGRRRTRRAAQHHAGLRRARGHPSPRAAPRRPVRRRALLRSAGGPPAGPAGPRARAARARAGAARAASSAARQRPGGAEGRHHPRACPVGARGALPARARARAPARGQGARRGDRDRGPRPPGERSHGEPAVSPDPRPTESLG